MTKLLVGEALTVRDPRKLGRWDIQSRLGFGGMGVVYLATDGHDRAAVKVVRPGLLDEAHIVERFAREVAVLQAVRDVHISQFLGADLRGEPAWLAIEYIPGPTLKQAVTADGALPKAQWWELARAMAQALAVLDVHRVVHRDVKPGNVILSDRPVLIDFGIAHPEDATSLTATGLVTGSPAWLSPEQANTGMVGAPSDMFALGSLLAFAGTGRAPFGEGLAVAVLVRISSEEPDLRDLDPAQQALVSDLLQKDPGARPTARHLLDRLRLDYYGAHSGTPAPQAAPTVAHAAPPAPAPPESGDTAVSLTPGAPVWVIPEVEAPVPQAEAAEPSGTAEFPALAQPPEEPAATRVLSLGRRVSATPEAPADSPPSAAPRIESRGARGEPAPRKRSRLPQLIAGGIAAVVLAGVGFSALNNSGGEPGPSNSASPTATSPTPTASGSVPAAPSSDQLRSGDWLLASYSLSNDGSTMSLSGRLQHSGSAAASADVFVYVFLDGELLGSMSATVTDVPAGGSTNVQMSGDFAWKAGQKVLAVVAQPKA